MNDFETAYANRLCENIRELERKVRELEVQAFTFRELLEETRSMHLRTEEHRDWLSRRDSALAMPKEQ